MPLMKIRQYVSKSDVNGNRYEFTKIVNLITSKLVWVSVGLYNPIEDYELFGDWEGWREYVDFERIDLPIRDWNKQYKTIDAVYLSPNLLQFSVLNELKPTIFQSASLILADSGQSELIASHCSDLYLPNIPAIARLLKAYPEITTASTFVCNVTGKPYFDIPFQFTPYWEAKQAPKKADGQ